MKPANLGALVGGIWGILLWFVPAFFPIGAHAKGQYGMGVFATLPTLAIWGAVIGSGMAKTWQSRGWRTAFVLGVIFAGCWTIYAIAQLDLISYVDVAWVWAPLLAGLVPLASFFAEWL